MKCYGILQFALLLGVASQFIFPVSVVSGQAVFAGSGLAGVYLLKLKAAAAVGLLLALKGGHAGIHVSVPRGRHNYRHYGGYSGGDGWGWRGKRDLTDVQTPVPSNIDLLQYGPSLDEILQQDELGCGLRLLCEISAIPSASLEEDEKVMLELFNGDTRAPDPLKASRGKLAYFHARVLGESTANPKVCLKVYQKCPHDRKKIMHFIRNGKA